MNETIRTCSLLFLILVFVSLPLAGRAEGAHKKTFAVTKGGLLQVSVSEGDIRISSWDRSEVQVSTEEGEDEDGLSIRQIGNAIRIESSGAWPSDGDHVDVTVPSQFDLDLQTGSGDLKIGGPLNGTISGKTGAGDIHLGNVGGRITLTTSGGDIDAGTTQGEVTLSTSGGDVQMGPASGEVKVTTSGGEITIDKVGKFLRASTSGGNITVGDVGDDATVSTAGGDVAIGAVSGKAIINTAGGNVTLRAAKGAVIARTAGGDLELENVSGTVEGSTAGGNVAVTLAGTHPGGGKLSTAAGDIRLVVSENARLTITARILMQGWWKTAEGPFDIRSDFKAESRERDEHGGEITAKYLLNGGGESLAIETMMGNIEIRKGQP
jgi:DUF4097 and DUF4098 domain-containing protein YvlB